MRPPGRSTRAISVRTARLVGREVDHAVRDHDVDGLGRERDLLDHALQEDARSRPRPRERFAGRARASRRSCRARRPYPVGPTRFAERITSMPPPEPRSSTVSPSCRSATAVGLPQPSEASDGRVGQLAALLCVVERLAELRRVALAVCAARRRRRSRQPRRSPSGQTPRNGGAPRSRSSSAVVPISSTLLSDRRRPRASRRASRFNEKYAHLPRCSRSTRPASRSFLMWWETVGCESPSGSMRLQMQTGSSLVASRLTIRTRPDRRAPGRHSRSPPLPHPRAPRPRAGHSIRRRQSRPEPP